MDNSRPWAAVRVVLGVVQMTAAAGGVILIAGSGINSLAVTVATSAALLTLTSLLLFRRPK
jgi:hypothetical protein